MPHFTPIDPDNAEGKAKALLDGVQKTLGMTPNIMRTMATSPAVLDAYLGFGKALSGGSVDARLREQIHLAVSNANGCRYCTSAHTAIGKMLGLDAVELGRNQRGYSSDARVRAALEFSLAIVDKRGWASDDDLTRVRAAGYGDAEIAEFVAIVAYNTFSNYFNHIAETAVDFPPVDVIETEPRAA